MDPNRNRTQVAFDILGMVVGTATMGKPEETVGDTLTDFETDLTQVQVDDFYNAEDPYMLAPNLLKGATKRIIYNLGRFRHTQQKHPDDPTQWQPTFAATLARETHTSEPLPPQGLRIQVSFSYSDGFAREIQKKVQAEPGPLVEGGPVVDQRWVGSGWTIFNNKGKPVRQYEPFFSQLAEKRHQFEFGIQVGVSPVLFYDPVGRVVATLHPNHTYEKVIFDSWQQTTWDVNDTVLGDPRTRPGHCRLCRALFRDATRRLADLVQPTRGRNTRNAGARCRRQSCRPRQHVHHSLLRHPGAPFPHRRTQQSGLSRS